MVNVVGCDPGISGALALIVDGVLTELEDVPTFNIKSKEKLSFDAKGDVVTKQGEKTYLDCPALCRLLRSWHLMYGDFVFYLEAVNARPGQGSMSTAKFMRTTGMLEGAAHMLGMGVVSVYPQTWKKGFGVTAEKETTRKFALDTFPSFGAMLKRKGDHNRAEAALIALYGYRQELRKA